MKAVNVPGTIPIRFNPARLGASQHRPHVEGSGGRTGGRFATSHLSRPAADDLLGEVSGVELGNQTDDAMNQLPLRCLVDVIGHRQRVGVGLVDSQVDRALADSVACHLIDLVNDDQIDEVGLEGAESRLRPWTVADWQTHRRPRAPAPRWLSDSGLLVAREALHRA